MRRVLCIILTLLLALGMAAGAGAEEKITLRMAVATGMQEYFTLADNYMAANPNTVIEIEEYPTTEISALLKAKLAGGDCWDIFPTFPTTMPTLSAGGHLADLSDMEDVVQRYKDPETMRGVNTFDGSLIALPAQYQYLLLFYNTAKMRELGLSKPTNFDEFLQFIASVKDADLIPIAAGFKENWVCLHWITLTVASTVQRDDIEWGEKRHRGEVTFESTPGYAVAFDKLKALIAAGAFSDSAVSTSDEQAMMSFLNGDALCYYTGTWGLNAILNAKAEDFEFGGMRVPMNDPGEVCVTATSVTGAFSIWSQSPHVAEAKKFLAFTLSPEQNLILNTTKGPSPFKDVEVPLDGSLVELEADIASVGGKTAEWMFYQQRWPDGMPQPEPMYPLVQGLFYPELAEETPDILRALDEAWDEATGY